MKFPSLEPYRTGGSDDAPEFAIPLPATPGGRTWRLSPNPEAHPRHFVVGPAPSEQSLPPACRARMKHAPRGGQTVCPYSGVVADDGSFLHPEDQDATTVIAEHAVVEALSAEIDKAMRAAVRGTGGGLSYKPNRRPARPKPEFAREDLMRALHCDHCGRDYGVYAIGLFCPDCGAPNVRLHFAREADLVGAQVGLAESQPTGLEELAYRLLGNAHEC